jgi:ribonuclease P protein component
MLARLYRLTQDKDFKRVYAAGQSVNGRRLRLKIVDTDLPHSRVAIVVANAISKRAVERNRIKRLMREAARSLWPRVAVGKDLVLSAQPAAKSATLADLQAEIRWLLERAHAIN